MHSQTTAGFPHISIRPPLWGEFEASLRGEEETAGSCPRPRKQLAIERGDEQQAGGMWGLAKEGVLTAAAGEELAASAVSLKREPNRWLVRCSRPCWEETEHAGVGQVDSARTEHEVPRGESREGTVGS